MRRRLLVPIVALGLALGLSACWFPEEPEGIPDLSVELLADDSLGLAVTTPETVHMPFRITNSGDGDEPGATVLISLQVPPGGATPFTITADPGCGGVIPAGQVCDGELDITGTTDGTYTVVLQVISGGPTAGTDSTTFVIGPNES